MTSETSLANAAQTYVKRFIFAPMEPCAAYTLEEHYRKTVTVLLNAICNFMLKGLVEHIDYKTEYEPGYIHRIHMTFSLTFPQDTDSRRRDYILQHFARKLGLFELKFLQGSWTFFDMDEPEDVMMLSTIAKTNCVLLV